MSKQYVPVDPEAFGCGILFGLIIHYWREISITLIIFLCLCAGCGFLEGIFEGIQSSW